jgi:hypothetical protein
MAEQKKMPREGPGHEVVEKMVAERVSQARKEEALTIYEDLLSTIWNRIQPTLGRVTVSAIMERALVLTKDMYPLLGHLQVTDEGVSFAVLHQQIGEEACEDIHEPLKELIANLIDILAMLTGDILVKQLIKEIDGRQTA